LQFKSIFKESKKTQGDMMDRPGSTPDVSDEITEADVLNGSP
jgi:hypothetical protein